MLKTKHGAQSHPSASTQRSHPHEYGQPGKQGVQYENTYKLEPDATFPSAPIRKIINEILQDNLENKEYSAELATQKCKELADMIKQRVKSEGYRRHKLVSLVTIVENKNAALSMGSRCVWNDKFDNYADGTFKNNSLYAVGCLYGLYAE
ncbi:hypothetical protein EB796_000310 [Bugula neritina]|uniref:TCTEX1D1 n=1 Tax=Bugula neritina TaxID=10212 RepID=A0A7J7KT14_BUGNE|nr:hypothetical protein EB796_000310 [Bugula neritina]